MTAGPIVGFWLALLQVTAMNAVAVVPGSEYRADPLPTLVRGCAFDFCPPSIPGPATEWPWTDQTRYLRLGLTKVALTNLDSSIVWTVPVSSTVLPDLVARGDFTGDGVADFIFDETMPASPPHSCGGHAMSQTDLVFVDGRSGAYSRPLPPTLDVCWHNLGYATHQWNIGTAYIGQLRRERPLNDVYLFPYYSTAGWLLSFRARIGWQLVRSPRSSLAYPSTAAYDNVYNSTNGTPCSALPGSSRCFVQNSHVPNAVFLGGADSTPGLFVLTSHRAFIYRPDLTPTSDFLSDYELGSGRNYGLVEAHDIDAGQVVTLIGGCGVAKTRDTMRTGLLSDDACGLQHHFEWYLVRNQSIVGHSGRFYGWAGTDGLWQNRLEFPFPSAIAVNGGSLWSYFNLYRNGQWRIELLPNPADPATAIEMPGWYAWGSVTDRAGQVVIAATRTRATGSTSVQSYVPPWDFDLLRWQNGRLVSIAHHTGVVPSLVLYPPGPSYHASDGDPFGLLMRQVRCTGPDLLLVETADGRQSYVSVPNTRTYAC